MIPLPSTKDEIITMLESRIKLLKDDVKFGHMARVIDGIELGYADENQAMIVVDHLMRIRIYKEIIEIIKSDNASFNAANYDLLLTTIQTQQRGKYDKARLLSLIKKYKKYQIALPSFEYLNHLSRRQVRELHNKLKPQDNVSNG